MFYIKLPDIQVQTPLPHGPLYMTYKPVFSEFGSFSFLTSTVIINKALGHCWIDYVVIKRALIHSITKHNTDGFTFLRVR